MFKKFISAVLVVVMLFTPTAMVFAYSQVSDFEKVFSVETPVTETFEHDGIHYYFHSNEYYTISMQFNSTLGELRVYRMDRASMSATYGVFEITTIDIFPNLDSRTFIQDVFSAMEIIKEFVVENHLILGNEFNVIIIEQFSHFDEECSRWLDDEMITAQEIIEVAPFSTPVTNPRVIRELNNRGHFQRPFFHIGSWLLPDVSARLYEYTTFRQATNILSISIAANSTVAAVALALNKTATAVIAMFKVVGGLVVNATQAQQHDVIVTYRRQARASGFGVNNFVWVNQFRDIRYRVTLGDLTETSTLTWSAMDENFNNRTLMMEQAINSHRQWFG